MQALNQGGPARDDELLPTWDEKPVTPAAAPAPPVEAEVLPDLPAANRTENPNEAGTPGGTDALSGQPLESADGEDRLPVTAGPVLCPVCNSPRLSGQDSCADCGYYFAPGEPASGDEPIESPGRRYQNGRFGVGELVGERDGVERYLGTDLGDGSGTGVPVIVLRQRLPAELVEALEEPALPLNDDLPGGAESLGNSSPITEILPPRPSWPSVGWERGLLRMIEHPALPRIVATFIEGDAEYLVEELPAGRPLWDAWDDPSATANDRFDWLAQIAEAVQGLHNCGAMLEGLRPELFVVTAEGEARFRDLADLIPFPLPPGTPLRGTLYTAPELLSGQPADARADLYSFGALLYALHVGRELTEVDFDSPGHPKPFLSRFPDIHPAYGRLLSKTFRREPGSRFPSDEAAREDSSGFTELIRTLLALRRTLDTVRLEIAAWTTTGMVRTGNEDAFALLHACESRQDDLGEAALVLLADGMGGYEAGEVAAAVAIQALRQHLVGQKPFAPLAGHSSFPTDPLSPPPVEGHGPLPVDVEASKRLIQEALREANRQVFSASRAPGGRRRGMGCTAEAVYIDGRHVVVGHVGDSRTYHLHEGRMIQLTRDQTLVNRLVELGTLSAEEAENHPRRNELQQAIGGQPDVDPGLYASPLSAGDWVAVCSDGLSNHVSAADLKQMLQSEAQSAEMAARRLVNLANIRGATDNATVVVIRAT